MAVIEHFLYLAAKYLAAKQRCTSRLEHLIANRIQLAMQESTSGRLVPAAAKRLCQFITIDVASAAEADFKATF